MQLEPFVDEALLLVRPEVRTRDELLEAFAQRAASLLPGTNADGLFALLQARERHLCTATPEGVAFPHAIDPAISRTLIGAATLAAPICFEDGRPPVTLAIVLFGGMDRPWQHVRLLASLARIVGDPAQRASLVAATTPSELKAILTGASLAAPPTPEPS